MPKNSLNKYLLSIAVGTGIGMLSSAILIFLMAAILTVGNIPAVIISPATVFFLASGGLFGGFSSAKISGEKGIFCGAASGTVYFLLVWISGAFFEYSGFGTAALIKAIMIIISGSLGGIIGVNYIKRK
jgi:putative membrane protein (TIGR04086 family)